MLKRSSVVAAASVLLSALLFSTIANADQRRDPPKPPIDKLSAALNVNPDQMENCLEEGRPASPGEKPNKSALLSCLQQANSNITGNQLDDVMQQYMPKPDRPAE
ncbi:hypothetical protein [uncultured Shewanella sp.]|uniref:hypothetical protein n=1 Tax=uncultured Shewanella sp. TaxID=173975 RepID=UPI002624ECDB|nr:hypothetical protein [uncultured Shewanella sp.]